MMPLGNQNKFINKITLKSIQSGYVCILSMYIYKEEKIQIM